MQIDELEKSLYTEIINAIPTSVTENIFLPNELHENLKDDYIELSVNSGLLREQISLGETGYRKFQNDGVAFVTLFTSLNTGSQKGNILLDSLQQNLEAKTYNLFTTFSVNKTGQGLHKDKFYCIIEINFKTYYQK